MLTLMASAPRFRGGRVWRARRAAHRRDGWRHRLRSQGAIHPPLSRGQALGTFLRSFRWGHVRQLDRVSRELLARAWSAGAGPGDGPLTIDLDSTICETYGLAKEGRGDHGYTGQRGYHPLGPPPHFASSPALALRKPVQSRPGTIASPSTPVLTAHVRH